MQVRGHWRPIATSLAIYAMSRAMLLGALTVAREMQSPNPSLTSLVVRWDATYYLPLVSDGYSQDKGDPLHAFFPLFPLVSRAANVVLPGGPFAATVVVSTAAGAAAAVLVWFVAARLVGAQYSLAAVITFCLFPGTVVFGWPYADSLLIALLCGSILLLTYERWLVASFVAAFATATKPGGLALAAACACAAWQYSGRINRVVAAAVAGVISVTGFVAFMVYLWHRTGEPTEWFTVERDSFGEGKHYDRIPATFQDIVTKGASFDRSIVMLFAALAIVLLAIGLLADQPLWAKVLTVVAMYFTLTAYIAASSPRFQLVAVPALLALTTRLRDEALALWCAASTALAFALVMLYTSTILAAP